MPSLCGHFEHKLFFELKESFQKITIVCKMENRRGVIPCCVLVCSGVVINLFHLVLNFMLCLLKFQEINTLCVIKHQQWSTMFFIEGIIKC